VGDVPEDVVVDQESAIVERELVEVRMEGDQPGHRHLPCDDAEQDQRQRPSTPDHSADAERAEPRAEEQPEGVRPGFEGRVRLSG
jgi:hypothetical protein